MLPRRNQYVDCLRAVAALTILPYHVIVLSHWDDFPSNGPISAFRLGWFGVDLFFVISGFVVTSMIIALTKSTPHDVTATYWRHRLARIVPLYYFTLVIFLAFVSPDFFRQPWNDAVEIVLLHLAFLQNLFLVSHGVINGPSWTLGLEMQFYFLIWLLRRWVCRVSPARLLTYAIVCAWLYRIVAYVVVSSLLHHTEYELYVVETQLPGLIDEFAIGAFLAKIVDDHGGVLRLSSTPLRSSAYLIIACLVGGAALLELYRINGDYWSHPLVVVFWRTGFGIGCGALLAAAIVQYELPLARAMKPLAFLGTISYGIYLWQLPVLLYTMHSWQRLRGIALLLVVIASVIGIAVISWYLIERPFIRWARTSHAANRRLVSPGNS